MLRAKDIAPSGTGTLDTPRTGEMLECNRDVVDSCLDSDDPPLMYAVRRITGCRMMRKVALNCSDHFTDPITGRRGMHWG
jgi:hypothetical protein